MDRLSICEAAYQFAADNHGGQGCKIYEIFGRLEAIRFKPRPGLRDFASLDEEAQESYRALCRRHNVPEPAIDHWVYGSGYPGCLYDYGPHYAPTKEAAIDGVLFVIEDQVSARTLARARRDLESTGIHYFDRRLVPHLGVAYLEISQHDGPCPSDTQD